MPSVNATVTEILPLGTEVKSFRFQAPSGTPFKGMSAGCHVDVFLPSGLIRQYSLWDWDPEGKWIAVGVKKELAGRGGSAWLHDNLTVGDTIDLGDIRNNFPLDENLPRGVLIAGGIGVTPMIAMARRLKALGRPFRFVYLARDEGAAGFAGILGDMGLGDALIGHLDSRDGLFDLKGLLAGLTDDEQIYFCGPEGMLKAVLAATEGWPSSRVHFERFSAEPVSDDRPAGSFTVVLSDSGKSFEVPTDKSILDVLLENGMTPDFGCMSGVCGACVAPVLEGEVDHRDSVMDSEAHDAAQTMCICVSRAKGDRLVLEL